MKKIFIILLIFIFILSINLSFAENNTDVLMESIDDVEFLSDSSDIYVSNEGSDSFGDGSIDNPYKTLNYTIGKAPDNSNIYLQSGTYNSTGYEIKNKSISITGIGDVTVDGLNGEVSQNIFKVHDGSSLVLNNIKFINGFADLEGSLSPIINEGELKIANCNFYNFTTINGVILNKNHLTMDNVTESKLKIDWKSVFGEAGNMGFINWIEYQITHSPSRGELITNIGNCLILNSRFVATVYNNRNMNITNSYLTTFISNRSYDFDINSVIDKSSILSFKVSNNNLLIVNNSFIDSQDDQLWYTNAIIRNSTFFNDGYTDIMRWNDTTNEIIRYSNFFKESEYCSFRANYCNISITSSYFNHNLRFDYSNINITHSAILGYITSMVDSYVNVNYNWWGDNKGPHIYYTSTYSTVLYDYWLVMTLNVIDNSTLSADIVKYTNGDELWDLPNSCDVNSRLVKFESQNGDFDNPQGYLVNGSYKAQLLGDNLNTMVYATVDNQMLRLPIGEGYTNYTWYISKDNGNDFFFDGSFENPFKTLSKAVSCASYGNTIYIMEGVYTLSWNSNLKISKELNFVGLGNAVLSRPNAHNIFIVDEKGILNIENINFTTSSKSYTNPIIVLNGGTLNIKNSNFYDTPEISGLINAYSSDSIHLDNVTFKNFTGGALIGNSNYVCVNNSKFFYGDDLHSSYGIIDVKANIDVLNSVFENNHICLIGVNRHQNSQLHMPLNIYIYNNTFINNTREVNIYPILDIKEYETDKINSIIDSCYFYNNYCFMAVCNVINNSTFINNTYGPFEYSSEDPVGYRARSLVKCFDLINNSYFYGNELKSVTYVHSIIEAPTVYDSVFIKNVGSYGVLSEAKEVHYCVFLNNTGIYGANDIFVYKGNLDASSNWWGSNQKPDDSRVQVFVGNLTLNNWVILNLTRKDNNIIASLDNLLDDAKNIFRLNHTLPSRLAIFTTDKGEITPDTSNLINNYAVVELIKNTTEDFDVYVIVDNQKLSLTIYNNSTQILIDDVTLYGKDNKYKIALINVNGHKISNQILDVVVKSSNGFLQPYTLTTDDSGVTYLNIDYGIGVYNVEVYYYGNGYFSRSSSSAVINISSISTSVYSDNHTFWGKNNRFNAILSDELGRNLLNQTLLLEIYNLNDKLLTSVNVITGTSGFAETLLSLDTGNYKIKWNYLGDEWYKSSFSYSFITIKPVNTTLILPNITVYGKGNDYEFTFTDTYGNKISDETVVLKIFNTTDSRDFEIKVVNGIGSININLVPGTYNLAATYSGDDTYGATNSKAILNIQKVILTVNSQSYSIIPENGVFTTILKDMYGKRVSGQRVSLDLYEGGLYKTYYATSDANGEANFKIDAPENIYFAIINFEGSIWYKSTTSASTIEISHNIGVGEIYLDGSDYVAYYGENGYYTILFNDTNKYSLEGMQIPIIISSDDFSKAIIGESDAFGNVRVKIDLNPGCYDITYKYENEYYNIYNSKTNKITIYKMPTNIIATNMIVKQGDNKNYEIKLLNKNGVAISNMPVTIKIDGKSHTVSTNAFGVAKLPLNLELGYHNVECSFDNTNYISSNANATILVVDDSRIITRIESNEVHSKENNSFNYTVILVDGVDNPIKYSQIILNITDDEDGFIGYYESYTNSNGEAIFKLNLSFGTYKAKTFYAGNDLYFESFGTNYIYINPSEDVLETILFGNDVEIINGYNQSYSIVLKTISGEFVSNKTVEFVVNGNSYFSTTDEVGRAYLNVPFKPGAYEVKTKFDGSNNLTKAYVTNYIRVSGELLHIYSQDIIKSFNNGTHYYVALFDALGQPMSGKLIKFIVGKDIYVNLTDKNGFACLELWFTPGTYNITATYQGQYPDEYATVSNTLTVLTTLLCEDITKYYDGTTMIVSLFLNFNDELLANTNVYYNINGVNYKVKTDEYGMATLDINLKAGNYKLAILNTLTGEIGQYNIKILSTLTTNNLVKYYKSSNNFKATFKDMYGKLLKNTYVKFTIIGKTYKVKTNSKGVAIFKANLKPGTYTITTLNIKTGEKHDNKITIKKTILTKNKKVKKGKKINFQAKILKTNGKVAKKVTIKFKINKKTYKVKTNNKGIAKLNIKLKKGKYVVKTTYNGLTVKNTVRCS